MREYRIVKHRGGFWVQSSYAGKLMFWEKKQWFNEGDNDEDQLGGFVVAYEFKTIAAAQKYIDKEIKYAKEDGEVVG